jgi:hypothetical protein
MLKNDPRLDQVYFQQRPVSIFNGEKAPQGQYSTQCKILPSTGMSGVRTCDLPDAKREHYYYVIFTSTNDFVNRLLENVEAHCHCMMSSGDVSVLSFSSRTNVLS